MHVRHTQGLDDIFNFETFSQSMMLLFQTSTSAGWDGVLAGLMNDQPPDCNATTTERRPMGDCGSTRLAILYLVTYLPAYLPAYLHPQYTPGHIPCDQLPRRHQHVHRRYTRKLQPGTPPPLRRLYSLHARFIPVWHRWI